MNIRICSTMDFYILIGFAPIHSDGSQGIVNYLDKKICPLLGDVA